MKIPIKIFCSFILFCCNTLSAQMTIIPGTHLKTAGNIRLVFANTGLVNNGTVSNTSGRIIFSGNTSANISGNNSLQIHELEIAKTNGASLNLLQNIGISGKVIFTSSTINLNDFMLDLGSKGILEGESQSSRITTSGTGQVWATTVLNVPSSANPGNLGASITSTQNLGTVLVKRGHQSQTLGNGIEKSILRYYDISATNNANLNATLRLSYLDAELNALPENGLVLWASEDSQKWSNEMFTARDVTANWVEKTQVNSFSRWTLSTVNSALPVQLLQWTGSIINCKAELSWKTASELSSSHFEIEHSRDGILFNKVGQVAAAGNSTSQQRYSFTMETEQGQHWFRLRMVDKDGSYDLSQIIFLRNSCSNSGYVIYPNPVKNMLWIKGLQNGQRVVLFNERGQMVRVWQSVDVASGFDLSGFAKGIYTIQIFGRGVQVWKGNLIKL